MTKSRPLRTSGAPAAGGPPRLDLKLRQHLFTLMLANLLPMLAVGVVMIGVAQGKWTLDTRAGNGVIPLLMVLGACVVLLASLWIILPFGRWLRGSRDFADMILCPARSTLPRRAVVSHAG